MRRSIIVLLIPSTGLMLVGVVLCMGVLLAPRQYSTTYRMDGTGAMVAVPVPPSEHELNAAARRRLLLVVGGACLLAGLAVGVMTARRARSRGDRSLDAADTGRDVESAPDRDPDAPMFCNGCGYDLGGGMAASCPECGRRFDPSDPATFSRTGRSARWLDVVVVVVGAYPLLVLTVTYGAWICARVQLGRWPRVSLDDPMSIGGAATMLTTLFYLALVGFLPAGGLVFLVTVVNALHRFAGRRRAAPAVLLMVACWMLWLATLALLFFDPFRVVDWLFD